MKQYKKFGVRLPLDVSARIEDVSKHTCLQRAVLLRHIILDWIDKKNINPAIGAGLGGTSPNAGGHQTQGAGADGS